MNQARVIISPTYIILVKHEYIRLQKYSAPKYTRVLVKYCSKSLHKPYQDPNLTTDHSHLATIHCAANMWNSIQDNGYTQLITGAVVSVTYAPTH